MNSASLSYVKFSKTFSKTKIGMVRYRMAASKQDSDWKVRPGLDISKLYLNVIRMQSAEIKKDSNTTTIQLFQ